MRLHLEQLAAGFRAAGADCRAVGYAADGRARWRRGDDDALRRRCSDALASAARASRAELLVLARGRLDFERLRAGTPARLAFWDWDGIAGEGDLPPPAVLDLLLSASPEAARRWTGRASRVRHLPHGVDLAFFAPGSLSAAQRRRFAAPVAFVGRPSPHRVELLAPLLDQGLALWGRRWRSRRRVPRGLRRAARGRRDVVGERLRCVYRASGSVLNILGDPAGDVLSAQVFAAPATGACLVCEAIPGLEEAFEPGREVAVFRSPGELREQVARLSRDREAARAIGANARRRCEAEHAWSERARTILAWAREL
jgi:glycosyltransferase involved in cell wall biosynthesis